MSIVSDALYSAAGSDAPERRKRDWTVTREPSGRRLADVRNSVLRFLEDLPDDMTVLEVREALDE